jgi:hypothetical protein
MAKGRRAERRRVTGRGRRSWAVAVLASLTATIVVWRLRTTTRAEAGGGTASCTEPPTS